MGRRVSNWLVLLGGLLALAGCSQIGPGTIPNARFEYNDAIVHSSDTQMLLNLVRLRYQDSILFLDLSSVVASYERQFTAEVAPAGRLAPSPGTLGASASVGVTGSGTWSETPTISYSPLQGEEFAKRLLAPIPARSILLLSRNGWGLERLLLCGVQQLNDLPNGFAIGGVAPMRLHQYDKFQHVAVLLRLLQEEGYVKLDALPAPEGASEGTVVLAAGPVPLTPDAQAKANEVISLLGVSRLVGPIALEAPSFPRDPASITLSGRSFLGVMTFLSQHVDVPAEHVRAGLERITQGADGKPFDWRQISHGLFHVHCSENEPQRAYVKVRHRGYWFWIDDADTEAKGTYTLLCQLFALQAASDTMQASPVLTIPTR